MSTTPDENAAAEAEQLSPEQQKALLERLLKEQLASSASPAAKPQVKTYPMAAGQAGLWHAFQRDRSLTPFNVFLPTRIRSKLDLSALQKALNCIASRHEALRTTFASVGDELVQKVHPRLEPEFCVQELGEEVDSDQAVSKARDILLQEMTRPFDLEQGPLLRLLTVKLKDDDFIILASTHHIVTDFWSLILTLNELRLAYPAFANGQIPRLPPPTNNFHELGIQQQRLLNGPAGAKLKSFWAETLDGVSPVVEFPGDFVRPTRFSHRADTVPIGLGEELSGKIRDFSVKHRATTFSILQAALQVFVHRYTGQEQFFIGSPFSGRSHAKYEKTLGFFVNMLPVKADLQQRPSFVTLTKQVANTLLGCLENESYPVANIVHDAQFERDPSRSPLFQVSCTLEKSHVQAEVGRGGFLFEGDTQSWDFGGLRQESFYLPYQTCHYDLEFIFEESNAKQLRGMLCFCRDLFHEQTAREMTSNFVSLLWNLLSHSQEPVHEVGWGEQLDTKLPGNELDFPATTVNQLFDTAAEQASAQVAIRSNDQELSYAELQLAAKVLASRLPAVQQQEELIPIITGRGPLQWIAQWACHHSRRAFVPIDSSQPSLPIPELLEQTNTPFVIADRNSQELLSDLGIPILILEDELNGLASSAGIANAHPCASEVGRAEPTDLAYVVYTSGSTGRPKGVMLEHQAVAHTLQWRASDVPLSGDDRVLMLLSHQFDAGLGLAWTTLSQGATLVMAGEKHLKDPDALLDLILQEEVTVLPAPPSLLTLILDHPKFPFCAQRLKYVWTGGEAMPLDMPHRVHELTKAKFFNFYGPTEAAIEATFCELPKHDRQRPIPIGRPIANSGVFILDELGQPVPQTVPGEIALSGPGLARGYLGAPELTDQQFIQVQHLGQQERVYRTGDRGRINDLGQVEFLGRVDHQVKLRGYRIELGEIEAVLEQDERVDRAAVVLQSEGKPNASLVAFVSLCQARCIAEPSLRQSAGVILRRHLSEVLPRYKVPVAVLPLDELPLTTSGKVDRKLLPEIDITKLRREIVPPETTLEAFLVEQWGRVLDSSQVSVDVNFFDAGGSSLQAAVLTSAISEELGVRVPTSLVFDLATISLMAQRLVELQAERMAELFGKECVSHYQSAIATSRQADHSLLAQFDNASSKDATTRKLFMVHPPGGIVVCYRELAQQLQSKMGDATLVGIRSRGLHGDEQLPASMEAMATDYISAVRSLQPNGPYNLGGWSVGGLVAYEMAQQLSSVGEQVSLTLLDTTIPAGASDLVPTEESVDVGREYDVDLTLEELGELAPEEQLPFLWEHAKKLGVLEEDADPAVVAQALEDLQTLFHHHLSLATSYRMQPLSAEVHLIRPQEMPIEIQVSEDRGWRHLVKNVRVDFAPGHHHSMVQPPHVAGLADKLVRKLGQ